MLPDAALAINASHDELVALLKGETERRRVEAPGMARYKNDRRMPPFLGHALGPAARGVAAGKSPRQRARRADRRLSERSLTSRRKRPPAKTVEGIPAHPGIYEGTVRIVNGPPDFDRLQQGDVLVARNTGHAFNVVLPLLGAIVTDRGGQLSHAAIVAREYGIPAVVGTRDATTTFPDGARVRVNGDKGLVELLS